MLFNQRIEIISNVKIQHRPPHRPLQQQALTVALDHLEIVVKTQRPTQLHQKIIETTTI